MRFGFAFLLICCSFLPASAQQVRRDDLKPGLIFTATDANGGAITRLEPTVALTLNTGEAAHPRSDGGTNFTWVGYVQIITAGKYTFDADLLGSLSVTIGKREVFNGSVEGETAKPTEAKEVELEAGIQPFNATLVRKGKAVRAALRWVGPGFRKEPVPYFFFGHTLAQRPAAYATDLQKEHGRFLFEETSCIKCHKAEANDPMAKTLADRGAPNLTEVGKRTYAGWLDAWLKDPKKLRPQTTMPQLFAENEIGAGQRYAVVSYLSSLGGSLNDAKGGPPKEIKKEAVPPGKKGPPTSGASLYLTAGCAACHGENVAAPTVRKKNDEEETEPLKPEDSFFGLGTAGGGQSFYTLGAVGSKTRSDTLASYLENPLATNPHGRMPNMLLSRNEAVEIAKHLCSSSDETIGEAMPAEPKLDPSTLVDGDTAKAVAKLNGAAKWKAIGQSLVSSMGCVNCHAIAPGGKAMVSTAKLPALAAIRQGAGKGCTSEKQEPGCATYKFTADERTAINTFLTDGLTGVGSPAPLHAAKTAIKRFNCMNCHIRDGEGGIDLELASKMKLHEKPENADDVNPPRLTGVGWKMRTSWMTEVILKGGRARPWMTLRMPQYGTDNVGRLPTSLPLLEGALADDAIVKPEFTKEKIEAGRTLTGKNGLGCISCHDISGQVGGGTRGPDLATTNQRVRYGWFVRWMHQPQRMVPGTKMPQVFLDGQSLLKTVYDGDGDKQLDALWAYYSLGPGLPLPSGLEPPKGMIVAPGTHPVILRTFLPDGSGTKGIAVGYPGGLNLAFDTQTNRIAYAWSGSFLDASPVWGSRGGGVAKILGAKFFTAPAANPWALTDSREDPDYDKRKDNPAYGAKLPEGKAYNGAMAVQFEGYSLDRAGAPTFQYVIKGETGEAKMTVAETPVPVAVTVANGLSRRFAVEVPAQKTAWFLAGVATKEPRLIGEKGEAVKLTGEGTEEASPIGTRMIVPQDGDRVLVLQASAMPAGSGWRVGKAVNGRFPVLLRLPENGMGAKVEFTLTAWSLPKDDEELLRGLK